MAASQVQGGVMSGAEVEVMPGRYPIPRISVEQAGGVLYEAGRSQGKTEQADWDRALIVAAEERGHRAGMTKGIKQGIQMEIDYQAKRKLRKAQKIEASERGMAWAEYVAENPYKAVRRRDLIRPA